LVGTERYCSAVYIGDAMDLILAEMYCKYRMLKFIKTELTNKGHTFKTLAWINGQVDLLDSLIQRESFNALDELLRKTNYRILKSIDRGCYNLVDIYNNPWMWQLGILEDNRSEWANKGSLIFTTEKQILIFSKNIEGYKYSNNKWQ